MSAGTVSTHFVAPAVTYARARGIAVDDLLAARALSAAALADPDTRIAFDAAVDLWEAIAARAGADDFGLQVARAVPAGHFDLHEYLVRCSPTLGDGLRRAFRYLGLISTRGSWEVELHGDEMRIVNRPPAMPSRHAHEFAIYSVLTIARRAAGRALPMIRLEMIVPRPARSTVQRAAFGCPLVYGCAANVLVFARSAYRLALPARDDKLVALIERHAAWMLEELGDDRASLADRVRRALFHLFQREQMSLARVARTLGTSERSLQRQLRAEGTSFRALVDEVRRDLALGHVAAGHLPISSIALLLDFSDTSAFHRSFRRWTGVAPSVYRRTRVSAAS